MRSLFFLLIPALAFGQAAPTAPKKPEQAPAAQSAPAAKVEQPKATEVPETAPVITINGVCDTKPGQPKPADCKTVITRAEFERLVKAVNPEAKELTPPQRQQLATSLSQLMVAAHRAEEKGLQHKPEVQDLYRLEKMNVLARELVRSLQAQYAHSSPAEIQKYYNEHKDEFEEASFQRVYIPKSAPGQKPADDATFQARAEKIRQEATGGADFNKLEQEAFDAAGIKQPAPPAKFGPVRLAAMPAGHKQVFNLKAGDVSALLPDPSGAYLYKLESKQTIPPDQAKDTIERALSTEKLQKAIADINNSVKSTFNPAYFGPEAPAAAPGAAATPAPKSAPKPAAQTKPPASTPK